MDDRHLSVELLRAVHRGDNHPGDLAVVAMTHLFDECSECREAFETWRREAGEGVATSSGEEYDQAFDRVQGRLQDLARLRTVAPEEASIESLIQSDRASALRVATHLLSLPRHERSQRVRSERDTYSGPLVADALLEKARACLPGHPDDAYEAAGLARLVLQQGRAEAVTSELYARALAHQGNARRVAGDLAQANDLLDVARFLLKTQGGGDRTVRAELDSFEGSLRGAQRRFAEAESCFSRAIMTYAMEDEEVNVAKALLSLGVVYHAMDDLDRAIDVTNQATDILEEGAQPHLQLIAQHNQVTFLIEAARLREAEELFASAQPLYARYSDPLTLLRRLWLEGRLARAKGSLEVAENAFRTVTQEFLKRGIGYDAALSALDLATLYAERGRTAELKNLAEELVQIFDAQDLHREAVAALMLFRDAVQAEQITLRFVLELSRYLHQAKADPSLQFRAPA